MAAVVSISDKDGLGDKGGTSVSEWDPADRDECKGTYFAASEGSQSTFFGKKDPRKEDDEDELRQGFHLPHVHLPPSSVFYSFTIGWVKQFRVPQRFGLILGPLFLLICSLIEFSEDHPKANEALACTGLIVIWWVTEVVPIPLTSIFPMILFPLTSVQLAREIARQYYNFVSFLFIGAFLVVVAVEKCNAHRRFALNALTHFGTSPRTVLFGIMLVSGVLSMFTSNTSTTILMIPVVNGYLQGRTKTADGKRFQKAALLGVAYGATSMGISTLIGTAPNAIFALFFSQRFPEGPSINFASWILFAFPIALIMLFISWGVLCMVYLRGIKVDLSRESLQNDLGSLGPMSRDELACGIVLLLMVILWLIRPYAIEPFLGECEGDFSLTDEASCEAVPGNVWSSFVDDSVVACFGAVLLFLIPSAENPGKMILDEDAFSHLPWGILLLFGAGFAIANAFQASGLSAELGELLGSLTDLSPFALVFCISCIVVLTTEVLSNTATISLYLPIVLTLAVENKINPLLVGLSTTIATSLAYQLPTATPPNAVVFATGRISFFDMIKAGIFVSWAGIFINSSFVFITGRSLTNLEEFPSWANSTSV